MLTLIFCLFYSLMTLQDFLQRHNKKQIVRRRLRHSVWKLPKNVSFFTKIAWGQTVLPDRSISIGQKLVENANIEKWDIFEWFFNTVLKGNKAQNFFLIFHDKGDEMDALIYTSYGISAKQANCVKTWSTMHEEDMSKATILLV